MKNELEQKKEYVTPKMEVVDMEHKTSLLAGSDSQGCSGYCGDLD